MFRARIQGAPTGKGWRLKYLSGMEEVRGIKPGYWLTQWLVTSDDIATFNFESEPILSFETEAKAEFVSKVLRESMEIETAVVRIGI